MAFIPWGLPPEPPIAADTELWLSLSEADQALGRLNGCVDTLAHPLVLDPLFIRQEAVLSCQIEGSQISLGELLEYEAGISHDEIAVRHVLSCMAAINYGLEQIQDSSISLELILACHKKYFTTGFQGTETHPGHIRTTQNYIGAPGCTIQTARYIPPPPHQFSALLDNLIDFLHTDNRMPALIMAGLAHAQFESIHPFEDGNGPLGRFLITLHLMEMGVLKRPLLYLSQYFRKHRKEYYDHLQAVRDHGDWENWLIFFLKGIYRVSLLVAEIASRIAQLRESHLRKITQQMAGQFSNALTLLDMLYQKPIISIDQAASLSRTSRHEAQKIIAGFLKLGLLREITGEIRDTRFAYEPYLELVNKQALGTAEPTPSPADDEEKTSSQLLSA